MNYRSRCATDKGAPHNRGLWVVCRHVTLDPAGSQRDPASGSEYDAAFDPTRAAFSPTCAYGKPELASVFFRYKGSHAACIIQSETVASTVGPDTPISTARPPSPRAPRYAVMTRR